MKQPRSMVYLDNLRFFQEQHMKCSDIMGVEGVRKILMWAVIHSDACSKPLLLVCTPSLVIFFMASCANDAGWAIRQKGCFERMTSTSSMCAHSTSWYTFRPTTQTNHASPYRHIQELAAHCLLHSEHRVVQLLFP